MRNLDRLRGIATQDHELAGIRDIWQRTDTDMQDEFVSWLEDGDTECVKVVFTALPAKWITWVQKCATAGLRQAVLEGAEVDEAEDDSDDT